jgi:hypothetical protein
MGNQSVTAVIRRGHTVCKEASDFRLLPSIEDVGIAAVGRKKKEPCINFLDCINRITYWLR